MEGMKTTSRDYLPERDPILIDVELHRKHPSGWVVGSEGSPSDDRDDRPTWCRWAPNPKFHVDKRLIIHELLGIIDDEGISQGREA